MTQEKKPDGFPTISLAAVFLVFIAWAGAALFAANSFDKKSAEVIYEKTTTENIGSSKKPNI